MRIDAKVIKERAMKVGAKFVGVGSVDRWDGAPENMHPKSVMPQVRSVITVGVPAARGMVETIPGHLWIREHSRLMKKLDEIVADLAMFLEDQGAKSCNVSSLFIPKSFMEGTTQGMNEVPYRVFDYFKDSGMGLPRAGYCCGIGTIGKNGLLLFEGYGPNVILGSVLTTAEIDADPIMEKELCTNCGKCVRACPAQAIGMNGKPGKPEFSATPCFLYCTMEGLGQKIAMDKQDTAVLEILQKTVFMQTEAAPGTAACGGGCLLACPVDKRARQLS